MKLELTPRIDIRQRVETLIDVLIEKIIDVGDYLVFKHITWTEAFLFLFSIGRAVWFVAIGVENANYSYYFGDRVWTTVFVMMSVTHGVGFFIKSFCLRVAAAYMCAVVWGILMLLAVISLTGAPAVPSLFPLIILSIVVAVRLSHEHKLQTSGDGC